MGRRHTLVHQIADQAQRKPDVEAIFRRAPDGSWHGLRWSDYYREVRAIAKGLIALGHQDGECVALVGANRVEWVLCQFGIMAAGGVPAPIYVTNTPRQVGFIVANCRAKIAVCDGAESLQKYVSCQEDGSIAVERFVTMDAASSPRADVLDLDALKARGREVPDAELDARLERLDPQATALLIYTSGTTGDPKGVMLSHDGLVRVGKALMDLFPALRADGGYRTISYLPLCHIAEQVFTNLLHLDSGGEVYFCPDIKQIKDFLTEVRPTVFLGVPRVWEKFEAALQAKLGEATGVKAKLAAWAMRTELDCFRKQVQSGEPCHTASRWLANKLVISKVKQKLGLDRLQLAATGAAPISVRTQEFFASLGICVYEGYGMSETTGVATVSDLRRPVFGSVGRPLDGVGLKIGDDGEILLKGPTMTRGYLHMPEKTAALFTEDGWLRTGDKGSIDADGNLRITGRLKDLIITSGGKNVAPAELEAYLKTIPGIGQAVVVGEQKPYLCALLSLDPEGIEELCRKLSIPAATLPEVAAHPRVREYFERAIEEQCNARVARYQTIKKFTVLPTEFSVETDELTPTMKIKRNVIRSKYADEIGALYAGAPAPTRGG